MIAKQRPACFYLGFGSVTVAFLIGYVWPVIGGGDVSGALGWMLVAPAALVLIAFGLVTSRRVNSERYRNIASIGSTAVCCIAITILAIATHRKYIVVFGIAQAIAAGVPIRRLGWRGAASVLFGLVIAWVVTSGLPYTPLANWFLNATPSTAGALVAFVGAFFALSFFAVRATNEKRTWIWTLVQFSLAALFFAAMSLRLDGEGVLWAPYHQNYYAAPADLVRQHHWLLWDIPSQYGFLSTLIIALMPGDTVYDSLYFTIAVSLFIQAVIIYWILRESVQGWIGWVVVILATAATVFGFHAAHYPFGGRLYPQESLRFLWPIVMLGVVYAGYRFRGMRWARFYSFSAVLAVWLASSLWSFETGAWTTIIFAFWILGELSRSLMRGDLRGALRRLCKRSAASAIALCGAIGVVEVVYRLHFGSHGPDWKAYWEFSAIYANTLVTSKAINPVGAGWLVLLVIGSSLALLLRLTLAKCYDAIPVAAACFGTLWATASYYVGEPFDQHVAMMVSVFVCCGAITMALLKGAPSTDGDATLIRFAYIPLVVILVAYEYGSMTNVMQFRFPAAPYADALSRGLPKIGGELLALERRAKISDDARVIFPSSIVWVKISDGLVLPLETRDGKVIERHSWLPLSPVGEFNTWLTLPFDRRSLYIERYLDDGGSGGWYITYRSPANCSALSTRLWERARVRSENYEAVDCELTGKQVRPSNLFTARPQFGAEKGQRVRHLAPKKDP